MSILVTSNPDLRMFITPEAIIQTPAGTAPTSVWARITGNLPAFCQVYAKMWLGGARTLRISWFEG